VFKHILIPTDGSPTAIKAVKAGIRFAHEIGAKVTAYHAIEDLLADVSNESFAIIDPKMRDGFERRALEAAQARLEAIGKLAGVAGVAFDSATTVDTPYKGIIATAKKHKCDVIFMASHGRRGAAALIMGSVTHKVLTHCKVPVLVYR
jgi:nucleotide-binding universal stress UspA family protein